MINTEAVLLVLLGLFAGAIVVIGPVHLHRPYWRKWSRKYRSTHFSSCPLDGCCDDAASRAVNSYAHYETVASRTIKRKHRLLERLPSQQYSMLKEIGHVEKLLQLDEAIRENSQITTAIASLSKIPPSPSLPNSQSSIDMDRIRESLQHFYRDWSEDGQEERSLVSTPICAAISKYNTDFNEEGPKHVLIPGSGHCRLAYDISRLGYKVDAVDNSYFMTLAARFIFSRQHTPSVNCHKVNPWVHWLSHQRSTTSTLRPVYFPDILPVPLDDLDSNLSIQEEDFLYGLAHRENHYDIIVTLFFIDTADNIIDYLERIHTLLKPNGIWINLGPLLWPSSASVELDLDEIIKLSRQIGLIPTSDPTIIATEYTGDKNRLIKYLYHAALFICSKQ